MASRRQSTDASVKAAIYARVSSDDGRQTTANQIQQLRELATARQFEIVCEYLDEETGASASRPSFLALLRDARLQRFRVLLITDLDRLTREGAAAGFGYLTELDRFGVSVVSLGQNWLDYDPVVDEDPELREMRSIQTAVALTCASLERQKFPDARRRAWNAPAPRASAWAVSRSKPHPRKCLVYWRKDWLSQRSLKSFRLVAELFTGCAIASRPNLSMPGIRDTAYPQLKTSPSDRELEEVYTPTVVELVWAEERTRQDAPRVGLLALLKTFQRVGYFVPLAEVPLPILEHVSQQAGCPVLPPELARYDASSARRRHMPLVRNYVGVKAWSEEAQQALRQASREAARTLEDLADIINFTLEQLVRQRFELPGFSLLHRAAQRARAAINREYHALVCQRLGEQSRQQLETLLTRVGDEATSPWYRLKSEPKQPTAQNNRDFLEHLDWLREQAIVTDVFTGIPDVKVKQFAAEARSLDVSSMNDLKEFKRLTLAAALVLAQTARHLMMWPTCLYGSCSGCTTKLPRRC